MKHDSIACIIIAYISLTFTACQPPTAPSADRKHDTPQVFDRIDRLIMFAEAQDMACHPILVEQTDYDRKPDNNIEMTLHYDRKTPFTGNSYDSIRSVLEKLSRSVQDIVMDDSVAQFARVVFQLLDYHKKTLVKEPFIFPVSRQSDTLPPSQPERINRFARIFRATVIHGGRSITMEAPYPFTGVTAHDGMVSLKADRYARLAYVYFFAQAKDIDTLTIRFLGSPDPDGKPTDVPRDFHYAKDDLQLAENVRQTQQRIRPYMTKICEVIPKAIFITAP